MARKPSKHVGTLGDLAFHNLSLTLHCARCCHGATMDLDALILANGADYLLRRLAYCERVTVMAMAMPRRYYGSQEQKQRALPNGVSDLNDGDHIC